MTTVGIKICKRTHVLFLSIPSMNFTFQKIMLHKHYVRAKIIQIFNRISLLNYIQINIISLGNLARFYLVIWHTETVILTYIVHPTLRQTYPSLLEIPNRVANSRHPFTAPITSEIIFSAVLRFSM